MNAVRSGFGGAPRIPEAGGGGPAYRVEIPASLHQNRPLEVVVAAADLSGHTAESPPRQLRRKGLFGRLRGGKDGG